MILRSVIKHVRDQNWIAVGIDFPIVVVGVFFGIQVANWNELRVERDLEQRYLERLVTAIAQDIVEHDDAVSLAEHRERRAVLLIDALSDASIAEDHPSELFDAVEIAGYSYHPNISDEVYEEMIATGNARIIRDDELRDAIAEYYSAIEARSQWGYIREHTQLEYINRQAGILTAEENRRIYAGNGTAEFSPQEARTLIERLYLAPDFIEWLPLAENWQIFQAQSYRALGRQARELLAQIQAALAGAGKNS